MTFQPASQVRQIVHWWVSRDPIRYRGLRDDLIAANVGMTVENFLLRSVLIAVSLGVLYAILGYLTASLFLPPLMGIKVYNPLDIHILPLTSPEMTLAVLRIAATLAIFFVGSYLVYFVLLKYPSIQKSSRATKINLLFHNVVSYMYAMRRGGTQMMIIFKSVAEKPEIYGEVAHEFRKIIRDTEYFGYDMLTAIRHLQETTPSDKLQDFLQDLLSVIESGGDVVEYLSTRVRLYQEEARYEQKGFLNTLQLVAEAYVTLFVAGPLFIIIIMVVMGFMSKAPVMQLSVVIYLLIPLGSLLFILFIDTISIKSEKVERYTGMRRLNEFPDVRRVNRTGEEKFFRQLERYHQVKKLKKFLRHPLEMFVLEPDRTFYVTVPLAVAYLIFTYLTVPQSLSFELYWDIVDDQLLFALLAVLIPYSIFYQLWRNKVMGLEAGIPDFMDRLASINQVGLTLTQAISIMVKANLGLLTYEIRRIKRDIDWGANINDALFRFEERIRTPAIARTVTLITKASQMTGDIAQVLKIAARDAEMSEQLKQERAAEMFMYTVIIYIVFFVFLFVVLVIDVQFLSVLAELNIQAVNAPSMATTGALQLGNTPIQTLERLLYHGCLVQAFFSGLIAGEMGEGSLRAGVKHAAIMVIIAFVVFAVFL
jgi:flagellar protein FlaJ